jgi:serine/threonine-protein kinase
MIDDGAELEGRYRILRRLGEGGMGAVYEAEHTAIGRRVAIKVLHAHVARMPDAVKRFAREARAAAEIGHPNIVEVFDTGTHLGEPFLVMELLKGETLAERLARPEMVPCEEACGIIGYVLSALAAAHSKGIIHRDLKPENVFLRAGEGEASVKLLDFGVSKFRRAGATLEQTTQEGIPLGTPAYMAPEQWMGRRDIDHRADLFAVGVMLYELLTGGLPYEGSNQGELFLEIVRGSSMPIGPSLLEEDVPSGLDAVVLRALDRERERRFSSAREFLDALRPYGAASIEVVDDPPAKVEEDPAVVSTRRALRVAPTYAAAPKRGVPIEVVGAALVAMLSLGAGAWWLSRMAPSPRRSAVVTRSVAAAPAMLHDAGAPVVAAPAREAPPAVVAEAIVDAGRPARPRAQARRHRAPRTHSASTGVDRLPVSRDFEP